jgi:hypothetical protein
MNLIVRSKLMAMAALLASTLLAARWSAFHNSFH